jgi:hypothetical protein
MANELKFVDSVISISTPLDPSSGFPEPSLSTVTFATGRKARLRVGSEAHKQLLIAEQASLHTIVTVSSISGEPSEPIVEDAKFALPAMVRQVMRNESGDLEVLLRSSVRSLLLRSTRPGFNDLAQLLTAASVSRANVAIAETPGSDEIIDAQPYQGSLPDAVRKPELSFGLPKALTTFFQKKGVTAADVFKHARSLRCFKAKRNCIPFSFPDDGCHARAHWVCVRAFIDLGVRCGKVWLNADRQPPARYGVDTNNAPCDCRVRWFYHVAPVYREGSDLLVVDPSLFDQPATIDDWVYRQDPGGSVTFTKWTVFDRPDPEDVVFDEDLEATFEHLTYYRERFIERINAIGLPPYDCG